MLALLGPVLSLFGGMSAGTLKVIAVGLAIFAGVVAIDRRATYRERAKCDVAKIESQLAAARADVENARKARAFEEEQKKELEREVSDGEKTIAKLREDIAKRPLADQCRFGSPRAPKR